mmetsp:Transcript_64032/g.113089  ORF Transcript_64032/g.113089 Transcript_64032/m.113089 type:complete len:538 (+) Transcript_64032:652-2265(+)
MLVARPVVVVGLGVAELLVVRNVVHEEGLQGGEVSFLGAVQCDEPLGIVRHEPGPVEGIAFSVLAPGLRGVSTVGANQRAIGVLGAEKGLFGRPDVLVVLAALHGLLGRLGVAHVLGHLRQKIVVEGVAERVGRRLVIDILRNVAVLHVVLHVRATVQRHRLSGLGQEHRLDGCHIHQVAHAVKDELHNHRRAGLADHAGSFVARQRPAREGVLLHGHLSQRAGEVHRVTLVAQQLPGVLRAHRVPQTEVRVPRTRCTVLGQALGGDVVHHLVHAEVEPAALSVGGGAHHAAVVGRVHHHLEVVHGRVGGAVEARQHVYLHLVQQVAPGVLRALRELAHVGGLALGVLQVLGGHGLADEADAHLDLHLERYVYTRFTSCGSGGSVEAQHGEQNAAGGLSSAVRGAGGGVFLRTRRRAGVNRRHTLVLGLDGDLSGDVDPDVAGQSVALVHSSGELGSRCVEREVGLSARSIIASLDLGFVAHVKHKRGYFIVFLSAPLVVVDACKGADGRQVRLDAWGRQLHGVKSRSSRLRRFVKR